MAWIDGEERQIYLSEKVKQSIVNQLFESKTFILLEFMHQYYTH